MWDVTCLVCGQVGLAGHLDVLLRCPVCGFVTARLHEPVDAARLYDGDYFTGGEYLDYLADEHILRRNFGKRLKDLLGRRSAGRLLEIGSAYGFFGDLARSHFDVVGYEVNRDAARHACERFGLDVRTDDFLDATADDLGGVVDVVVMWDVIEHLERPDRFIAHIAELSKAGALLYITTGDIGSRIARLRGRKWRMIHPPSHLHYFDRQTIARLLTNYGYEVTNIRHIGVARSFRQILYSVLAIGLKMPGLYKMLNKLIPARWGFTINTGDIMQVVARKQ